MRVVFHLNSSFGSLGGIFESLCCCFVTFYSSLVSLMEF